MTPSISNLYISNEKLKKRLSITTKLSANITIEKEVLAEWPLIKFPRSSLPSFLLKMTSEKRKIIEITSAMIAMINSKDFMTSFPPSLCILKYIIDIYTK